MRTASHMTTSAEPISLSERLRPRLAREEQFRRTGRKLRKKSLLFKYERYWMRPLMKLGLSAVGLYRRGVRNALTPMVRHLHFHMPTLPPAFDGYTVLHISDFHIDGVPGLTEVLTQLLPSFAPDLCVITGDYRFEDHGTCEHVYPLMRQVIRSISARDGMFGILGNHDWAEIALHLDAMGLRMLVNEAVEIRRGAQSIWLAGIDDPFDYRCDDLPGALRPVPPDAFKILAAHTPELYETAATQGISLYLCGHTHAGQIRLPVVGSIRNNAQCPPEYAYGSWQHGGMQGYTTSGIGCSGLPIRYNCPPEAVMIHLHRHTVGTSEIFDPSQ